MPFDIGRDLNIKIYFKSLKKKCYTELEKWLSRVKSHSLLVQKSRVQFLAPPQQLIII